MEDGFIRLYQCRSSSLPSDEERRAIIRQEWCFFNEAGGANFQSLGEIAMHEYHLGEFEASRRHATECIENDPECSGRAYRYLAKIQEEDGTTDLAYTTLTRWAMTCSRDPESWEFLAQACWKFRRDGKGALEAIDIGLKYCPRDPVLTLLKSEIYTCMKEIDKAYEWARIAIMLVPDYQDAHDQIALIDMLVDEVMEPVIFSEPVDPSAPRKVLKFPGC